MQSAWKLMLPESVAPELVIHAEPKFDAAGGHRGRKSISRAGRRGVEARK
jgi:hypothetical protein